MFAYSSAFSPPSLIPTPNLGYGFNQSVLRTPQTQRFAFDSSISNQNSQLLSSPLSAYNPKTPSPLRELKNVKVLSGPIHMGSEQEENFEGAPLGLADGIENCHNTKTSLHGTSNELPFAELGNSAIEQAESTGPFGDVQSVEKSIPQPQMSIFSFNAGPQMQPNMKPRSRHQTPQSQLSSHTSQNRLARKSQFLNRLKNQRTEDRDDRIGDQVLRGEYLRQQKSWENFYSRQAEALAMPEEEEELVNSAVSDREVTEIPEDLEMEENYYPDFIEDEMSDDGYDELFMEVLSQQQQDQQAHISMPLSQQLENTRTDNDLEMS